MAIQAALKGTCDIDNVSFSVICMWNPSLGAMNLFSCGGDPFAFLGFSLTKTAENSE